MKIIKQSTYETCLACCLLMLIGEKKKDEMEIWKHGWKFNYLIGQLNYVSKKYKKEIEVYIENNYYFEELQKQKNRGIKLISEKINTDLLLNLLSSGPVIVYLDGYSPENTSYVHAPHFVIALRKAEKQIEIIDPFFGNIKKIPVREISKAISSLRNRLKYSPVLIRILKDS